MDITNIISYITSFELQQTLWSAKLVFLGIFLFFLLAVVIFLFTTQWLRFRFLEDIVQFFTYRPYGMKRLTKPWAKIFKKLDTGRESEYKLAIIEADSLMNEMLKKSGYSGKTLEEKVSQISLVVIPDKEELLNTHKIRNELVSNPDYRLDIDQAKKLLATYQKTLIDLGLL